MFLTVLKPPDIIHSLKLNAWKTLFITSELFLKVINKRNSYQYHGCVNIAFKGALTQRNTYQTTTWNLTSSLIDDGKWISDLPIRRITIKNFKLINDQR